MPRRKKEPHIDPEEIKRLERLLAEEVEADRDLKEEMRQIIASRSRELNREMKRMEERNRRLIIWIGVTLVMVAVAVFWVANLVSTIRPNAGDLGAVEQFDVEEVKRNLTETMNSVIKNIDELKKQAAELDKSASSSTGTAPESGMFSPTQ